jgi:hypothetical protein
VLVVALLGRILRSQQPKPNGKEKIYPLPVRVPNTAKPPVFQMWVQYSIEDDSRKASPSTRMKSDGYYQGLY